MQKSKDSWGYFYYSEIYQLIRDGVSDMRCMSDAYLVEEMNREYICLDKILLIVISPWRSIVMKEFEPFKPITIDIEYKDF